MPFSNIYKSSAQYAINDLVKEMDLSLWKEMLHNIAQVLDAPAVGLILTSEVGFQNIAMSTQPGIQANPGKIIPIEVNLYCKKVMETKSMLYVKNATGIEEWQNNPELTQMGYVSYLGLPILHSDGTMFATLCALDTKETKYQPMQINLMSSIQALLEREVHIAEKIQKLKFTSLHDDLTQVFNRRGVMIESESLIRHLNNKQASLGVIYFDLDGLKRINDNFGHNMGDHYIRSFAASLKNNMRFDDICGRLGGDEFIVFCKNSDPESLKKIVARIQHDFKDNCSALKIEGEPAFSQGTLFYPYDIPSVGTVINTADAEMYQDKLRKKCIK